MVFLPPVGCSVPTLGLPSLTLPAFWSHPRLKLARVTFISRMPKRFLSWERCLSPPSPNAIVTGLQDGALWVSPSSPPCLFSVSLSLIFPTSPDARLRSYPFLLSSYIHSPNCHQHTGPRSTFRSGLLLWALEPHCQMRKPWAKCSDGMWPEQVRS